LYYISLSIVEFLFIKKFFHSMGNIYIHKQR